MHDEDEVEDDEVGLWWFVSKWYGVKEVEVVGCRQTADCAGLSGLSGVWW